jgi:hypothetical protein
VIVYPTNRLTAILSRVAAAVSPAFRIITHAEEIVRLTPEQMMEAYS